MSDFQHATACSYMHSVLYAIARPSVCLSVYYTGVSYKND